MSKFKLKGVGLDMESMSYPYTKDHEFDYIHTNISSNNSWLIPSMPNTPVIVSLDFLDCAYTAISGFLAETKLNKLDLLLINSKCDFAGYIENLSELLDSGLVERVGIKNPETPARLDELKAILDFSYVSLPLCPLEFNYEVIEWCKKNEVGIIGFNPYGGRVSGQAVIDSFSVPYLLGFAATYCDLVFLSGHGREDTEDAATYLNSLKGQESDPIYELKKSIHKLYKPLKKAIKTTLQLNSKFKLPYNSPDSIYNQEELTFGLKSGKITLPEEEETEFEAFMKKLYDELDKPKDATRDEDFLSVILPKALLFAKIEHPQSQGWNVSYCKLDGNSFVILISRETKSGWFKKKEVEQDQYLLHYSEEAGFVFRHISIENAPQGPSNS